MRTNAAAANRHYAIVPAAGSGERMSAGATGTRLPKQYLPLLQQPVLWHALSALCAHPDIVEVIVVLAPDDVHWVQHDWSALGGKLRPLFHGGMTRAHSVLAGLRALSTVARADDWVLVHDAARACLARWQLERLLREAAASEVGGLLAVPVGDTLKQVDARQQVVKTVARDGLWQAQTPQMFRYRILRRALESNSNVTDEAAAIEAAGLQPQVVASDASNLKITWPLDLHLARWILQSREEST